MGLLNLFIIFMLLAAVCIMSNVRTAERYKQCQVAFAELKNALINRHSSARQFAEVAEIYQIKQTDTAELVAACTHAEQILEQTCCTLISCDLRNVCTAESEVNRLLRLYQADLLQNRQAMSDMVLKSSWEAMDASENRMIEARNEYNRCADRYNRRLQRLPARLFSACLGCGKAETVEFEDNNVSQASERLMVSPIEKQN